MLDLKFIRENPALVRKGIRDTNETNRVDEILDEVKALKIEMGNKIKKTGREN